MIELIRDVHPVLQALMATVFTWGLTAAGAALIFVPVQFSQKFLDGMLGFTGGVMIAASFWSLLQPSILIAEEMEVLVWLPAASGFVLGALSIRFIDAIMPHLHLGFPESEAEGVKTVWHRTTLLVLAITLHNIPEGLAVGVAFGAAAHSTEFITAGVSSAVVLATGIGIQNFPEGLAVSMPLHRNGVSRGKSFWYGQLSAIVEPFAGVIGAATVLMIKPILPYALSFAAGAMIFVVVEEVIPESQQEGHTDTATMGLIAGFTVMMILDVQFG